MDMGLLRARDAGCRKVLQRRKIRAMGMLSDKNGKCKGLFDGLGNSREPNPVQQNITGLPAGNFSARLARPSARARDMDPIFPISRRALKNISEKPI